jgi:hypothetical protein
LGEAGELVLAERLTGDELQVDGADLDFEGGLLGFLCDEVHEEGLAVASSADGGGEVGDGLVDFGELGGQLFAAIEDGLMFGEAILGEELLGGSQAGGGEDVVIQLIQDGFFEGGGGDFGGVTGET